MVGGLLADTLMRTAGLRNRGGSEQEVPTQAVKATQSTANADPQYHVDLSLVGHVVAFQTCNPAPTAPGDRDPTALYSQEDGEGFASDDVAWTEPPPLPTEAKRPVDLRGGGVLHDHGAVPRLLGRPRTGGRKPDHHFEGGSSTRGEPPDGSG